ncbi:membrane fusion protein (multidrug efflux system) [Palleronia aestuarii]|uniref:Membrane fusion protein (Multidrug efflux system) n=1 Tax=Palleronia aestuarii TaxID=568105 RepID=A0A2W7NBS3_9RHOB|nr:HlyD family secretion protein [Palleronia aestuarii]PZX17073.1 membrane fusion protein (multidrug efflux system) [Palleronia aestuarii]
MSKAKLLLIFLLLVSIAGGLWWYWRHEALYPSTDDAYVQANVVTIVPEVSGRVTEVAVQENQRVAAGDLLFRVDPATFQDAVDEARAAVDAATASGESYASQVETAKAALASARSAQETADAQLSRSQALAEDGTITQAALEQDRSAAAQAAAGVSSARSQLAGAEAAVTANADDLATAQAQLRTAETTLARAEVTAPVDGWIANLSLREGAVVSAYTPLFSIVDAGEWWVEANFRETDLDRVRPGMPARVEVDMIPGTSFTGSVGSIGRGSGATFSLLPAENASGNWVRVTQRFPVRITLDDTGADLRAGASASVTVDTTGAESGQ